MYSMNRKVTARFAKLDSKRTRRHIRGKYFSAEKMSRRTSTLSCCEPSQNSASNSYQPKNYHQSYINSAVTTVNNNPFHLQYQSSIRLHDSSSALRNICKKSGMRNPQTPSLSSNSVNSSLEINSCGICIERPVGGSLEVNSRGIQIQNPQSTTLPLVSRIATDNSSQRIHLPRFQSSAHSSALGKLPTASGTNLQNSLELLNYRVDSSLHTLKSQTTARSGNATDSSNFTYPSTAKSVAALSGKTFAYSRNNFTNNITVNVQMNSSGVRVNDVTSSLLRNPSISLNMTGNHSRWQSNFSSHSSSSTQSTQVRRSNQKGDDDVTYLYSVDATPSGRLIEEIDLSSVTEAENENVTQGTDLIQELQMANNRNESTTKSTTGAYKEPTKKAVKRKLPSNDTSATSEGEKRTKRDPYEPRCSICGCHYDTVKGIGKHMYFNSCGHLFCQPCIQKGTKSCSKCKKKVLLLRKLFL